MRVVFLDVDGVLNTEESLRLAREQGLLKFLGLKDPDSDRHMLDPGRIELLDALLVLTGADVVISSSWRYIYELPELVELLKSRGFKSELRVVGELEKKHETFRVPSRGNLIQKWLKAHSEYTSHVAIDDDPDAGSGGTVLVKTDRYTEGITPQTVRQVEQAFWEQEGGPP